MAFSPSGYWVIIRTDQGGGYVALPGSKNSYTKNKDNARRFSSYEHAQSECCGNETPVPL